MSSALRAPAAPAVAAAGGVLVLMAAVTASQDERLLEGVAEELGAPRFEAA